jgi:hypothetical protein
MRNLSRKKIMKFNEEEKAAKERLQKDMNDATMNEERGAGTAGSAAAPTPKRPGERQQLSGREEKTKRKYK